MSVLDLPRHIQASILHYIPLKDRIRFQLVSRRFTDAICFNFKLADSSIIDGKYGSRNALNSFFAKFGGQLRCLRSKACVYQIRCDNLFENIACYAGSSLRCLVALKWHIPLGLLHHLQQLQILRTRSLCKTDPEAKRTRRISKKLAAFSSKPAVDLKGIARLAALKVVEIETIDADVVRFILTKCTTEIDCLKSLNIQFDEMAVVNVGGLVSRCPNLVYLAMTSAEVSAVSYLPLLSNFRALKELHLRRCDIGALGADDGLPPSLTLLNLYRCYNVRSRALLTYCTRLEELTFFRGSTLTSGHPSAIEILSELPTDAPLRVLMLSDSEVCCDDILQFLIHRRHPIEHLEVRHIRGSSGGFNCSKLCQYLQLNRNLKLLYLLNHSSIDDTVFASLEDQQGLETLTLQGTSVTAEGLNQLCEARKLALVVAEANEGSKHGEFAGLHIHVDSHIVRNPVLRDCESANVRLHVET